MKETSSLLLSTPKKSPSKIHYNNNAKHQLAKVHDRLRQIMQQHASSGGHRMSLAELRTAYQEVHGSFQLTRKHISTKLGIPSGKLRHVLDRCAYLIVQGDHVRLGSKQGNKQQYHGSSSNRRRRNRRKNQHNHHHNSTSNGSVSHHSDDRSTSSTVVSYDSSSRAAEPEICHLFPVLQHLDDSRHHDNINNNDKYQSSATDYMEQQTSHPAAVLATATHQWTQAALLGCTVSEDNHREPWYMNTHRPFSVLALGQGAHQTLTTVLENCLLDGNTTTTSTTHHHHHNQTTTTPTTTTPTKSSTPPSSAADDLIRLDQSMTALVLHYDTHSRAMCAAAAGLVFPDPLLPAHVRTAVPTAQAVILVSAQFYQQRLAFYGDRCGTVKPLLFPWRSLTVRHLQILLVQPKATTVWEDGPAVLALLRRYQRQNVLPATYREFVDHVKAVVGNNKRQLEDRLAFLESVLADDDNDDEASGWDIVQAMAADKTLITLDLTDPLLSQHEASLLFQVATEQFRSNCQHHRPKLLALDAADHYLDDALGQTLVDTIRHLRDDDLRLVVSAATPAVLPGTLVAGASLTVVHQPAVWDCLRQHLPAAANKTVPAGRALVVAGGFSETLKIRRRLTLDFASAVRRTHDHEEIEVEVLEEEEVEEFFEEEVVVSSDDEVHSDLEEEEVLSDEETVDGVLAEMEKSRRASSFL